MEQLGRRHPKNSFHYGCWFYYAPGAVTNLVPTALGRWRLCLHAHLLCDELGHLLECVVEALDPAACVDKLAVVRRSRERHHEGLGFLLQLHADDEQIGGGRAPPQNPNRL